MVFIGEHHDDINHIEDLLHIIVCIPSFHDEAIRDTIENSICNCF